MGLLSWAEFSSSSNSLVYSILNSVVQDAEDPLTQDNLIITADKSKDSVTRRKPRLTAEEIARSAAEKLEQDLIKANNKAAKKSIFKRK